MTSSEEIVRQIKALADELGQTLSGVRGRVEVLTAELDEARAGGAGLLAVKQEELESAEKRIETLVQKLKEARQEAAAARDEARRELQQRLELLEKAAADTRDELEKERSIRKRLEKGAAADEKRLLELEKALAEGKGGGDGDSGREAALARLQAELKEALETIAKERQGKMKLETRLGDAHALIESLELAVKQTRDSAGAAAGETGAAAGRRIRELVDQLAAAEARIADEQREARQYAKAHDDAEKRIVELEQALSTEGGRMAVSNAAAPRPSPEKPLPHELRPAPKPGVLFRPDWDLEGLPCKSVDQVLQAWGSVFNVQLSLEGYPSQYCTAFLAVIKQGKQKQLYMVFNLKSSKHVLVCVPSKPPGDEAALNKLVGEGQKYLQMSGFELERIKPGDVEHALGPYCGS